MLHFGKQSGFLYSTFRENFKECLKGLGYDEKLYGLHSFRAGVATTIAKNLIAPTKERLLKLHGRWKTDICKNMYVKIRYGGKTCGLQKLKYISVIV